MGGTGAMRPFAVPARVWGDSCPRGYSEFAEHRAEVARDDSPAEGAPGRLLGHAATRRRPAVTHPYKEDVEGRVRPGPYASARVKESVVAKVAEMSQKRQPSGLGGAAAELVLDGFPVSAACSVCVARPSRTASTGVT